MTVLNQLLADLKREYADLNVAADAFERQAATQRHDAMIIAGRIQGIEETMAALARPIDDIPQKPRKHRRNIREMVARIVSNGEQFVPADVARSIGCKVSQVEAALRAINGENHTMKELP